MSSDPPALPVTPEEWEAKFAQEADGLLFGREPSELLRLALPFWTQAHGERRGRALELGCGEGRDAVLLEQAGFQVTAIDAAPTALARARRAAGTASSICFRRADIRTVPLGRGWQLITAHNSLQFLGSQAPARLRNVQRATAAGGFNCVSVFTRESEQLAHVSGLWRLDHNELRFLYQGWRLLFYSEDLLWRENLGCHLSFARIIAQKPGALHE